MRGIKELEGALVTTVHRRVTAWSASAEWPISGMVCGETALTASFGNRVTLTTAKWYLNHGERICYNCWKAADK